ncbi:MAG: hypothetical protein CVU62_06205 [Deltaproteobacteria bacterium HGW-Deltaproteobacteria-2]|jgi:hypothetical protein|nr:MAG: hypothetical protein CVU62_06205 [Deltaproteobacteria bacterium HGW-Deltaproteobacteria-2]
MERPLSLKQSAVVVSILASLWLLKHPYNGIWHDGVIYTFMALKDLYPDVFASDLFIKFGSQGSYTIFPQIYAILIKSFGIYKSALVLTVFSQLLWIFAAVSLFRTFVKEKELCISLAILFFMRAYYGGFNCFQYAEPFVSPRIFSEALCILGVASIIKGRHITSAVLFFISFLIHPLMTLGAGFIVYVYLLLTYPRVLFSAPILVAAIFFLGIFKTEPFAGIFRVIPPEWHQIISVRSSFMFLTQWPLNSWAELFFSISITAAACLFSKGVMRRLFFCAIIGACCGMLVNIIGGELLRLELIMQIQAWRSLWFLQFISALGATVLIINFLKLGENRLLLCSFFVLTWYTLSLGVISFGITLIFLYLCVQASRDDLPPVKILRPVAFLIIVIVIIINIILPDVINMIRIFIKNDFHITLSSQLTEYALLNLFLPLVLLPVIFFFYYHWGKSPSLKIAFLSFAVLIFSLAVWDHQSPWSKMLERNQDNAAFFRDILPQNATILWDASTELAWFGARRPSYISAHQGSGVVFYQKTAIEYARRINVILPLMDENPLQSKEIGRKLGWGLDKAKFKSNYSRVCRNTEELDYIVSTVDIPGRTIAHWRSPFPVVKTRILDDGTFEESKEQAFYLYDCGRYKKK